MGSSDTADRFRHKTHGPMGRAWVIDVAQVREKVVLDLIFESGADEPADKARPEIHRGRGL